MEYVDQTLMEGETVVHRARRHALVFLRPALVLLAAAVAAVLAWWPVAAILAAVGLVDLGITWLAWTTTEFAVTNMRVVMKRGILQRETSETLIQKVESVDVHQGMVGRLLDYGDVVLRGTGGSTESFTRIARPLLLRRHVQEQVVRQPAR